MNSRKRVLRAINHREIDRIPLYGDFHPIVWKKLKKYYETNDDEVVRNNLGIDFRMVFMDSSLKVRGLTAFLD